ncbi:ion channel [Hyella patelloides]|nr:ion channel [Hyella patelloides]
MNNRSDRRNHKFWINFRNGRFEIPNADAWHTYWQEPYYLLLTVPWWGFFVLTVLSYITVNGIFALGYLIGGDCIENATSGSFGDAFFFSVQTLTSIGYGAMYPTTAYADILVTTEALVGIVGIALMTGLAFTKFSQPTAKVIFSQVATISDYNGVPTLALRTANQRRNQIIEAEVRVYLMRDEVSIEGEYMRRFYLLKLLRNQTPRFTLSWTVMHPIDENSPLWQATSESLVKTRAMLVVSLNGIDETVCQPLHAPYCYSANEILWSHRFADIVHQTPEGHHYIDYTHFHNATPVGQLRNEERGTRNEDW